MVDFYPEHCARFVIFSGRKVLSFCVISDPIELLKVADILELDEHFVNACTIFSNMMLIGSFQIGNYQLFPSYQ